VEGGLERRHVRGRKALEAAKFGVHGDEDDDGLELLGGEEAEEELVWGGSPARARALVLQHRGEGRGDAQVDVVGEAAGAACRDDAHVEQLREERVRDAHDGGGLRGGGAAPGGRELRVSEGGQELDRIGDEARVGLHGGGGVRGGVRGCVRGCGGGVRGCSRRADRRGPRALHRWHGARRVAPRSGVIVFCCVFTVPVCLLM
jgi:hypothetical protein